MMRERPWAGRSEDMRVVRATDVTPKAPEEYGALGVTMREIFTAATGAPTFALRHFEVAPGAATLRHFHPWEHEVYILGGTGELIGEDGIRTFTAGDCCYTAPNELHQFRNTGATPLRFLCAIPNQPSVPPVEEPSPEEGAMATPATTKCDLSDWRVADPAIA